MPDRKPLMRLCFHGDLSIAGDETGQSDLVDTMDDSCWRFNPRHADSLEAPFCYDAFARREDSSQLSESVEAASHAGASSKPRDVEDLNPLLAPMLQIMLSMDVVVEGVRAFSDKIDYCQERAELWSRKMARFGPHRVRSQ